MRIGPWLVLVAIAAVGYAGGAAARAQEAPGPAVVPGYDGTRAQRLFGELMSPFCPGLTLATCPSPGAESLRADIRARLAHGQSARAIRAVYVADWGEQILGAPRLVSWGVLLWVTPAVLLVFGAAGLSLWLRRQRRLTDLTVPADAASSGTTMLPDEPALRRRLEEELAKFDGA
jgi:cytochrome c-type biogenesis protein CcmH/NrfF